MNKDDPLVEILNILLAKPPSYRDHLIAGVRCGYCGAHFIKMGHNTLCPWQLARNKLDALMSEPTSRGKPL